MIKKIFKKDSIPMNKNKLLINLALLFTLISIALHIYLTKHFFDVRFLGLSGPSICNISEYFNCDAVAASRFSSLFGIPIALWGVITNLVLFISLIPIRWASNSTNPFTSYFAKGLATLIFATSIVMGFISISLMEQACIFCIGTYLLSFLTFLCLWWTLPKSTFSHIFQVPLQIKDHPFFIFLVSSILWAPFFFNFLISESTGVNKIEPLIKESLYYWKSNPSISFKEDIGLKSVSTQNPPQMTIVEFADYLCPHCKVAANSLHNFIKQHPDVLLVFKPFPLDGNCNAALAEHLGNGIRCLLPKITFCMEKLEQKGWLAHEHFFEQQEVYMKLPASNEALNYFIENFPIKNVELKNCISDTKIETIIKESADEGALAKIEGTPSIFVNGRKLDRGHFLPILESTYQSIKSEQSK